MYQRGNDRTCASAGKGPSPIIDDKEMLPWPLTTKAREVSQGGALVNVRQSIVAAAAVVLIGSV
jgi:hypothetical protein